MRSVTPYKPTVALPRRKSLRTNRKCHSGQVQVFGLRVVKLKNPIGRKSDPTPPTCTPGCLVFWALRENSSDSRMRRHKTAWPVTIIESLRQTLALPNKALALTLCTVTLCTVTRCIGTSGCSLGERAHRRPVLGELPSVFDQKQAIATFKENHDVKLPEVLATD